MSKEEQLADFLTRVPSNMLGSEWGKRMVAKRKTRPSGKKVLRECVFCKALLGAREMRLHVAKEHPGGLKSHEPVLGVIKGQKCLHCDFMAAGPRSITAHMRKFHSSKISKRRT